MRSSARTSTSLYTATKTMAANTALGRLVSNPVKKRRHSARAIEQTDENAELEKPGDQAKQCHGTCRKTRDLRASCRVPSGQRPDGAGNHERDRGGRANRKLARRSKESIAYAAKHIAVDADLGRQPGKARIGQ